MGEYIQEKLTAFDTNEEEFMKKEIEKAINKLKYNKAEKMDPTLLDKIQKKETIPKLSKRGNLANCDNWRDSSHYFVQQATLCLKDWRMLWIKD